MDAKISTYHKKTQHFSKLRGHLNNSCYDKLYLALALKVYSRHGGHTMKTTFKLAALSGCTLFLASCASFYSITPAQSQGTTIQGMRKKVSFYHWTNTSVQSIDHKDILTTASFFEGGTYAAPVIPNQPHTFKVWVHYERGFWKYAAYGDINATLQPGHQYFVAATIDKTNVKTVHMWIQTESGKRISPSVAMQGYIPALP